MAESKPVLEAVGLHLAFGGLVVLSDINLKIGEGEVVGVVGPNGAGKSSLLNCVSRVYSPKQGSLFLNGVPLRRLSPHRVARLGVARSLQQVDHLTSFTVRETLRLGTDIAARIIAAGGTAGTEMADVVSLLELDDVLDEQLLELDYGTRKLVDLGRALVTGGDLLLLDEPTSGVDALETSRVAEVLTAALRGSRRASLVVDHNPLFVAELCNRMVVMALGSIIADGDPESVLSQPAVVDAFLGGDPHAASGHAR